MFIRVSHNYAQIGLNDPLNDILKTAEVVRGALGDIKSICSSEDIYKCGPTDAAGRTLIGQ